MDLNTIDQTEAVKYLLGELTEAEQARLEEQFFHDAALSEALSEAEDDLIDQYAREELSPHERERFEGHFLISERRREKVKFARALLQAEHAASTPARARDRQTLPWWKSLFSPLLVPRPALSYSLAAVAFLFLVGTVWLFSEVRQLRNQIAQFESERETRERQNQQLNEQVVEQGRLSEELAAQKEKLEQDILQLQRPGDGPDRQEGQRLSTTFATFILLPGARGSEGLQKLTLPPGARAVRLQLNLRPGDEYSGYQVKLQPAGGGQVRNWNGLRAASAKGVRAVLVEVQASQLRAGQYEVTLSGVAKGQTEPLGYYYFDLTKD